jgi:hypothetical protein
VLVGVAEVFMGHVFCGCPGQYEGDALGAAGLPLGLCGLTATRPQWKRTEVS